MFNLFIGDICEDLAFEAKKFDPDAFLLDRFNFHKFSENPHGTVYTSIGDLVEKIDQFINISKQANKIFYRPPIVWNDQKDCYSFQREYTEHILFYLSQYIEVDNLKYSNNRYKYLNQEYLSGSRISNKAQGWAVGCSITAGIGVNTDQIWSSLVFNHLKIPHTNISRSGSSILWQSDQICCNDIRAGDLVFWALPGHHRVPVIDQNQTLVHLNDIAYEQKPELLTQFPECILKSSSLIYHNVLAVKRVYNFCKKIGAHLIILGVGNDHHSIYHAYNIPVFFQVSCWSIKYIDLGTDNVHPGPLQHKIYAEKFLELYNKYYITKKIDSSL